MNYKAASLVLALFLVFFAFGAQAQHTFYDDVEIWEEDDESVQNFWNKVANIATQVWNSVVQQTIHLYDITKDAVVRYVADPSKIGTDIKTYSENKWDLLQRDPYRFFESTFTDYRTVNNLLTNAPKQILMNAAINTFKHNVIGPELVSKWNCKFYLAKYADLRNAFGSNCDAAHRHWQNHGMREGRMGNGEFDCFSYLARYSDLRSAFADSCPAAENHWYTYGVKEGRDASFNPTSHYVIAAFNCPNYLSRYSDLRAAFGSDCSKALTHWVKYGITENRLITPIPEFDCYSYLARYNDLRTAYADNCGAAVNHYYTFGIKEGRNAALDVNTHKIIGDFQCEAYLAKYADLRQAFGSNCDAARAHWVKYGISEGRSYQ